MQTIRMTTGKLVLQICLLSVAQIFNFPILKLI